MSQSSAGKRRAARVLAILRRTYPDAECELKAWTTPFELAVAAILSAQCTDKRVNMVAPPLFARYRTPAEWAATPQATLENEIRSTGFFRNKASNIRAMARIVADAHGGRLPADFDTLVTLPGIGRKTANLLVAAAFGGQGVIVDTHCSRVSRRLGFTAHTDPVKIEFDLRDLVPERDWSAWSHGMVFHGRRCCEARKPACGRCPVADLCPSAAP